MVAALGPITTRFGMASKLVNAFCKVSTVVNAVWLLWRFCAGCWAMKVRAEVITYEDFRGFRLPAVRAAREPREDDAQSVGVPSARRFWRLPVALHGLDIQFCDGFSRVAVGGSANELTTLFDRLGSGGVVSGQRDLVASLRPVATAFGIVAERGDATWSRRLALSRQDLARVCGWLEGHMVTIDKLSLTLVYQ
ncbi:hypothetical protein Taro_018453, partial [Colocasia esculenta]|nr:hypothetical protein [Colocasia esculenta]